MTSEVVGRHRFRRLERDIVLREAKHIRKVGKEKSNGNESRGEKKENHEDEEEVKEERSEEVKEVKIPPRHQACHHRRRGESRRAHRRGSHRMEA